MKKNVVICSLLIIVFGLLTGCSNPSGGGDSETGSITITLAASNARFAYPPKTTDLAQMYGVLTLKKDSANTTHRFWGDKGLKLTGLVPGSYTISLKVYYFFGDRIDNDNPPTEDGEHVLLAESAGSDPTLSFTLAAGENKTIPVSVYKQFTQAVEIDPYAATVAFGRTAQFHAWLATVTDLHLDDEFTWTLEGNTDAGISINAATGLLSVASSVTTEASFTVRATSKTDSGLTETAAVTVKAPEPMPGNPSISGDNWVNGILMANLPGTFTEPGTVSYQWKRGAAPIGTDSDEYTVTALDAGQNITVEIEHSAYSGNATSTPINILNNKIAVTSDTHWGNLATVMNAMPTTVTAFEVHVTGNHNGAGYTSNTFGTKQNITVDIKGTVTNGENSQINLAGQGSLLCVGTNQTVTMTNLNLHGQGIGENDPANSISLVYIIGTNVVFTMNGGVISGNKSGSAGGGLYVSGTGAYFAMSGSAKVSGNTTINSSNGGGGVYVNGGTFTMSGNAEVSGNTSTNYLGGGVTLTSGTLIMSGSASVSGNKTEGNYAAGGIFVSINSIVTMQDNALMSGNIARGVGGAVYMSGGSFTMNGGEISGNESEGTGATHGGGGVAMNGGTFTMNTGEISHNKAANNGGGVFAYGSGSPFIMNGGKISGNTASNAGGGLYVSGTFTMTGGAISDNTGSGIGGGGVWVGGTFTMTGGEISGNTGNNGGGVSLNGTFNMKGGEVKGNTANSGGGVYVNTSAIAKFLITDGIIYGSAAGTNSNTATNATGGAALYKGANGVAEYGTFSVPGDITSTWNKTTGDGKLDGELDTTNDTFRVVNGVLQ